MEDQNIEEYLKNLKLKKKVFGGYDEEDVFLKINDLIEIQLKEIKVAQHERDSAQKRALEFEHLFESEKQLRIAAKAEVAQLEEELKTKTSSLDEYNNQTNRLNNLFSSIDAAKDEILLKAKSEAMMEAEKIRMDSIKQQKRNEELSVIFSEKLKTLNLCLDMLLSNANGIKSQLTGLVSDDE